jgi:hypothetical protein
MAWCGLAHSRFVKRLSVEVVGAGPWDAGPNHVAKAIKALSDELSSTPPFNCVGKLPSLLASLEDRRHGLD